MWATYRWWLICIPYVQLDCQDLLDLTPRLRLLVLQMIKKESEKDLPAFLLFLLFSPASRQSVCRWSIHGDLIIYLLFSHSSSPRNPWNLPSENPFLPSPGILCTPHISFRNITLSLSISMDPSDAHIPPKETPHRGSSAIRNHGYMFISLLPSGLMRCWLDLISLLEPGFLLGPVPGKCCLFRLPHCFLLKNMRERWMISTLVCFKGGLRGV